MISYYKCWTGRAWVNIGSGLFAIGFGKYFLPERIMINKKLIYAMKKH